LIIKTSADDEYLFVGNQLYNVLSKDKWLTFNTQDLKAKQKKSEIVLSFYGRSTPEEKTVLMGFPTSKASSEVKTKLNDPLNFLPRSFVAFQSSHVLIFIFFLAVLSFIANNYTKAFRTYYNFRELLSTQSKEKVFLANKPLDRPNMMFVILVSVTTAYLVILAQSKNFDIISGNFIFQTGQTFGVLIANFFKLCIISFVLFIGKYFFIGSIGKLFNIEKIVPIHYFKLIQSTLIFLTILLIMFWVALNTHQIKTENFKEVSMLIIAIFYSLRTILIYFSINRGGTIKILYLISYLCIVEVLPIIIGLRLVS
jgi:Domain of unknown function (DUF4271)